MRFFTRTWKLANGLTIFGAILVAACMIAVCTGRNRPESDFVFVAVCFGIGAIALLLGLCLRTVAKEAAGEVARLDITKRNKDE